MSVKICECCGQEIRTDIDLGVKLSRGDRTIVNAVHKAGKNGILTPRLFDILYSDDPDGGPETGMKTLHTRVHLLNRKIKPAGYYIRGEHSGGERVYGRYFLYRTEQQ